MKFFRHINPDFFTHVDIIAVSPLARLLLLALWFEADDDGCFRWCVKTLKRRYLPTDSCDIQSLGNELVNHDLVHFFDIEDKTFALVLNFENDRILTRCGESW